MDQESQESSFDIEAASDQIASDLFGSKTEDHDDEQESHNSDKETGDDEGKETETEGVEPEPVGDQPGTERSAPASWTKEMREHFAKLPKEVQDYIDVREKQMADGLKGANEYVYFGREMKDALSPYSHIIQEQGLSPAKAVQSLMNVHVALSKGTDDQKLDFLKKIANSYGIDINGFQAGTEKEVRYPPEIQAVIDRLNRVESIYQEFYQNDQQANYDRARSVVESFANDAAHPYFDEVADEIVIFFEKGLDLDEAYEKAVWANPVTRQKEIVRLQTEANEERLKKQKENADKAKQASSVNVKSRESKRTPTEPLGSMDDTMRETLSAIKSRG